MRYDEDDGFYVIERWGLSILGRVYVYAELFEIVVDYKAEWQ